MAEINQNDWLLSLGFDVRQAEGKLRDYARLMRGLAGKVKDRRSSKWLQVEGKRADVIATTIKHNRKDNPVVYALDKIGQRLFTSVQATWRTEMSPQTYRYLNAIKRSPVVVGGNTTFVCVGNWRDLMRATTLEDPKMTQKSQQSWVRPKGQQTQPMELSKYKKEEYRGSKIGGSTYVASTGQLRGETIEGYWYFQEAGFVHKYTGQFIHHPVFSVQNMGAFHIQSIQTFDRRMNTLLKRTGRWAKWGGIG